MSVITISREFGSEGDRIAQKVAQTLDYHFVDQKFIGTILGQYGYVEFDKEYANFAHVLGEIRCTAGKATRCDGQHAQPGDSSCGSAWQSWYSSGVAGLRFWVDLQMSSMCDCKLPSRYASNA